MWGGGSKNACTYYSFGSDGSVLLYIGSGLLKDSGNYLLDIRLIVNNVLTIDSKRRWPKWLHSTRQTVKEINEDRKKPILSSDFSYVPLYLTRSGIFIHSVYVYLT